MTPAPVVPLTPVLPPPCQCLKPCVVRHADGEVSCVKCGRDPR